MDFYQIKDELIRDGVREISPRFQVCRSKDLMVRGGSFYAIWDEARNIWSTDEYDIQRLIDQDLEAYAKNRRKTFDGTVHVKSMVDFSSNNWSRFKKFLREMSDNAHQLDEELTFSNTIIKKKDHVSKRLPYPLESGTYAAYDELIGTLYEPEERNKLEWAVGAIIAGDAKNIQKFIVLYGEAGSGKSTFLNILQKLFVGYYTTFEAKALTGNNNAFSTEPFKTNPLVAIQHDGDLSKIEDNTKLNSIIAHEEMTMNEKYRPSYTARSNAFLFMGTNKPVKITDAQSGIIRRLVDVRSSGKKVSAQRYQTLMAQIDFELGAIAYHCLEIYNAMGKHYYSTYRPLDMMFKTDVFFNFVEDHYHIFKEQDGITLSQAYEMYKKYCEEVLLEFRMPRYRFREDLKSYFSEFHDRKVVDGEQRRSYYSGFLIDKFSAGKPFEENPFPLVLEENISLLDSLLSECPAQYGDELEKPLIKWDNVQTKLADLNTKTLHYLRPPINHIVIDFDIKDENGNKSNALNLKAASQWPTTYAEFSKGGHGIHLHYIYEGDVKKLKNIYSEGIEVKVFNGNASLRRRLSKCNKSPVARISSGLPLKGEKMVNFDAVQSEKGIRNLIARNLKKEIHPGTKPSIDFIFKILEDAYKSGMHYDVTDLRPEVLVFANNSTNQADYCIKLVNKMAFKSDEISVTPEKYQSDELIFFDVEVFPNLFVVCWKAENKGLVKMINPKPSAIEELLKFKLVGFNCRRYDNHILYARYIGYDNNQLFKLSQKIINGSRNALFGEAYSLSYTDVYDFSSKKQSLKRFQIELGIHHKELGLKWDEEVPENLWDTVADYCGNDVISTQATFENRKQDFIARLILADLSGLTPNDTTQMHTAKIIFGDDKNPQDKFVYTDLSQMFSGYKFDNGTSTYRSEEVGEGGYVYAEPGMYSEVAVLDVASMHPTSLVEMDMFGPYTKNFRELLDARIAIKHKDYETARQMLGGILNNYLTTDGDSGALAYALKIVINIVYGLTSAKFENRFRDPRNKDNIVAKRGALFMIDLKHAVQEKGFIVAHIKTDSIKIPNATPEIIEFVMDFGKAYGYTFEHETTYSKFCLVNNAVYIAQHVSETGELKWEAVGAQFSQPYVFKTLFSHEPIQFIDMIETKTVTSALYLDMNEGMKEDEHDYHFIGKAGAFCPVRPGCGGGLLVREKDGKFYAATGSKGFRWLEAEMLQSLEREDDVDRTYHDKLVEEAKNTILQFGDFDWFVSESTEPEPTENPIGFDEIPPWCEKGSNGFEACQGCENFIKGESYNSCKKDVDLPF